MKQEALAFFTDIHLTNLGLILFMVVFIGVLAWVFRAGSKKHYDHMANLPLNKES